MRLRNKKTGEIKELTVFSEKFYLEDIGFAKGESIKYNSLAELNEEWEDYEEPKDFYIIEQRGIVGSRFRTGDEYVKQFKEIGNYFETKEEADLAVRKLKVWKRLRDKGFRFVKVFQGIVGGVIRYKINEESEEVVELLNLLFGGEE